MERSLYRLVFLRHGESIANAQGLMQGQADYELSEKGIHQAERLADRWKQEGEHFDRIVASPLLRARRTGEIIAQALGAPIELNDLWMERNAGKASGLPLDEVDQLFPRSRFTHPYQPVAETGESQWELYLRGATALHDILRRPPGSYLVVSHGGIFNQVLYAILGIAPQPPSQGPRFAFGNTGFATFIYEPQRHVWRMIGLNDQRHLPPAEREETRGWGETVSEEESHPVEKPAAPTPTGGLVIRRVRAKDLDSLLPVLAQGDQHHWEALPQIFRPPEDPETTRLYISSLLLNPDNAIFAAELDGHVAGVLLASLRQTPDVPVLVPRRYASIDNVVVDRELRGRGIGRALLEHAHQWAAGQGVDMVELTVWEFNENARKLYESLGYKTASRKMWLQL